MPALSKFAWNQSYQLPKIRACSHFINKEAEDLAGGSTDPGSQGA